MKSSAACKQEEISVFSAHASPIRLVEYEETEPVDGYDSPVLFSKEEFCRDRATD
jgi:hypothetical protein